MVWTIGRSPAWWPRARCIACATAPTSMARPGASVTTSVGTASWAGRSFATQTPGWCCRTSRALGEWDVPIWDQTLDEVHVTRVDQRSGRREAGVCQHLGELRPSDWVTRNGVPVTTATRTAMDCASLLDVEHGVVIVGDLLHRKLTTLDDLVECAEFMERWPGSLKHRVVLRVADGRCESVGEHRTLHLCWQQRLPRPIPQYKVRDPDTGEVLAVVDFAWPEHGVFLEFDGKIKYQKLLKDGESPTDVVVREKRREELICRLTGWRCIRIVWADLYQPERTAAAIRALLRPAPRSADGRDVANSWGDSCTSRPRSCPRSEGVPG